MNELHISSHPFDNHERIVYRLFPDEFDKAVPDLWKGVTLKSRVKGKKKAVTRDDVYLFAWGCIKLGCPEAAAAAVICFEWLQRPENVLAGCLRWTDYRSKDYAKETYERALAATRKRHAHLMTNEQRTEFRNATDSEFRNDAQVQVIKEPNLTVVSTG